APTGGAFFIPGALSERIAGWQMASIRRVLPGLSIIGPAIAGPVTETVVIEGEGREGISHARWQPLPSGNPEPDLPLSLFKGDWYLRSHQPQFI
ncbi:hypothetical protein, partial [Komagataeibacter oboediens]|uniref:hypothetical protein n=1 Tax=Komagataeibacter oboediens TaxID=65958 RepID=UPI001E48CC4D